MENKMIARINQEIEFIKKMYDNRVSSETHMVNVARLNGMVEMLSIATGKEYYYDNDGLHERK